MTTLNWNFRLKFIICSCSPSCQAHRDLKTRSSSENANIRNSNGVSVNIFKGSASVLLVHFAGCFQSTLCLCVRFTSHTFVPRTKLLMALVLTVSQGAAKTHGGNIIRPIIKSLRNVNQICWLILLINCFFFSFFDIGLRKEIFLFCLTAQANNSLLST